MGRLIDEDKLKEAISKSTCHWTEHMWKNVVCDVIDNQPTAYDIEKVVTELEEVKGRYRKEDFAYRGILEKVSEIVRKGGVE